jgi:DNA invertase Pin-like site-specific DNA recombinase
MKREREEEEVAKKEKKKEEKSGKKRGKQKKDKKKKIGKEIENCLLMMMEFPCHQVLSTKHLFIEFYIGN